MMFFTQQNINNGKELSLDHNDEWTLCADPNHIYYKGKKAGDKSCDEKMSGSRGSGYRGCQTRTRSGRTCQAWSVESPHRQGVGRAYPAVVKSNYCRNPDGEPTIWCYTTDRKTRWDFCRPLSQEPEPCDETLMGPGGSLYRGCQTRTRSGRSCLSWSSQSPHRHTRTPRRYPRKGLGNHEYCRNPDGEPTIWCYTTDPNVRWEFCDPLP